MKFFGGMPGAGARLALRAKLRSGRCVLRRSRSRAPAPLQPEFPPQPRKAA